MLKPSKFVKIRVAVPVDSADAVRRALAEAGAGVQGNYDQCSASWKQVGRFRPLSGAKPAIGAVGALEAVEEEVIETLCSQDKVAAAVAAVKKVHPYEEPAIDIISRFEV
jgi:hypothetical protein